MANNVILVPQSVNECKIMGEMMAKSDVVLPMHLRNKPADCMAIAMQAAAWGMSPYSVAQKTHIVSGKLGYEAQLVNAVISSSTAIKGRFHYETVGDWSKIAKKNWLPAEENGLGVRVGAILHGETEITWGDTVYLATVATRNSPLWKTNPLQQLKYLALKYWARIYTPDVIMGVYTPDELVTLDENYQPIEKEINNSPKADDLNAAMSKAETKEEIEEAQIITEEQKAAKRKQAESDRKEKAEQVKAANAATRRRPASQATKETKVEQPQPKATKPAQKAAEEQIEEAEYTEVKPDPIATPLQRIAAIIKKNERTQAAYKELAKNWKALAKEEKTREHHQYMMELYSELTGIKQQ